MHGHDHRLRVAVHRTERLVITGVDGDDPFRESGQFLDVDTGAETASLAAQHDDTYFRVCAQGIKFRCQRMPAGAIERVYRRFVDHQFGDAVRNFCVKWLTRVAVVTHAMFLPV